MSGSSLPRARAPETQNEVLSGLRRLENERREQTDFARPGASEAGFGADPYRLAALPDGRSLALLRGSAELQLYGGELALIDRAPAPRRGSALALGSRFAFAGGELDGQLQRYEVSERLRADLRIALPGLHSVRALAAGTGDLLYAASEEQTALFVVREASSAAPEVQRSVELCRGVQRLAVAGSYLIATCLLDHELVLYELDPSGMPTARSWRARHDGPFWGIAAAPSGDGLLIAASGVEDHPLDRRIGSFGFIDSFVYLYELQPGTGLQRRLAVNASEHGVLTPRALLLERAGERFTLLVEGFGSARALQLELSPELELLRAETHDSPPGSADLVRLQGGQTLSANTLLDALRLTPEDAGLSRLVRLASADARSPLEKLGEALEYTSLMAPANPSAGALSRFTCETCHFEGGLDGRIHATGRGDIVATTKPLRGLFNNRPFFSRALDPDLTQMVHNEFRAAGAGSKRDPWFSLAVSDYPWLAELGVPAGELPPAELRRALLAHFMLVGHPPNPFARPPRPWSEPEQQGAELFRQRCEGCHEARLVSDTAQSRMPFEAWHDLVFSEAGPIVWARDTYEKTGIVPLVHPRGARVPSLRRVYAKFPYFTNGSAESLEALLGAARWSRERFYHRAPAEPALEGLSAEDQAALLAFLLLL